MGVQDGPDLICSQLHAHVAEPETVDEVLEKDTRPGGDGPAVCKLGSRRFREKESDAVLLFLRWLTDV